MEMRRLAELLEAQLDNCKESIDARRWPDRDYGRMGYSRSEQTLLGELQGVRMGVFYYKGKIQELIRVSKEDGERVSQDALRDVFKSLEGAERDAVMSEGNESSMISLDRIAVKALEIIANPGLIHEVDLADWI